MLDEIILAIVQAATEFLPVSSSGHLALVSGLFGEPDVFFFTVLHVASLLAVLIFTRKEIFKLLSFDKKYKKMWLYLILGTIPAAFVGYFYSGFVERQFSSLLFVGSAFIFTGIVLLFTKNAENNFRLNWKNSFVVGLAQVAAIFPGISRSGMTISVAKLLGVKNEEAFKFSFLLFVPLVLGALVVESGKMYFSLELLVAFVIALVLSLFFLKLLYKIVKGGKFWMFSFYCFAVGVISILIYFLR